MNTKKIIIVISIILFYHTFISAQSNQEFVNNLYSDDFLLKFSSILVIEKDSIIEALPVLNELIESQPPLMQKEFLSAMAALGDPNLYEDVLAFMQRSSNFDQGEYPLDSIDANVFGTSLLFSMNDFSTYHYIFASLKQTAESVNITAFNMLKYIIDFVPEKEDSAKQFLIDFWDNSTDDYYRSSAMRDLVERYGLEFTDRLIYTFENDSMPLKISAFEFLSSLKYSGLQQLLRSRLPIEESWSFRATISDTLLKKYGLPTDLKIVKDYQPTEPNSTARSYMNHSLKKFIPPKPDSTVTALVMTDTLISYNNQLYNYQWITSDSLHSNYSTRLQTIRDYIANSNYTSAQTEIDDMQTSVEENYNSPSPLLTTEGWKFLHYYLEYIGERINN